MRAKSEENEQIISLDQGIHHLGEVNVPKGKEEAQQA